MERHGEHQSRSQQFAETILDFHGRDEAGGDDEQVQHQHGQHAHQAEFLAERGVDEIGVRERDERGMPLAQTGAEHAARRQSEYAGDQLPGAAGGLVVLLIAERVQPGVDALTHVAERAGGQHGARGERDQTDDDPAFPAGGRVQHGHEHGEEHERSAQVTLHDQHAHRSDPHHDDGAEVLDAGQLQPQHLPAAHGQPVAVIEQVCGEEEREEQFGELARLELAQSRNPDPDARAVHLHADERQHRGEQQH